MTKVVEWAHAHKHKVVAIGSTAAIMSAMGMVGVSANGDAGSTGTDISGFINSIKGALSDFTTTNLATIIVAALSLTVGLAIAWFAYRFIKGKVSSAMRRGKL